MSFKGYRYLGPCVPCVPCVSRLPPVSFYRRVEAGTRVGVAGGGLV